MRKWLKDTDIIWYISFFLLVVVSRAPFIGSMLYHMDAVQFALALDHYDVAAHQPHPPGYFLYVMLGRFFHLFIQDANRSYVFLNILLSGLTVSGLYHLGKEIADKKTGVLAAAFALVSPTLWFHGGVALSYAADAFFSTALAVVCWKTYKGEESYVWLSAVVLAIAGGVRQNTAVFLLPFWLFSLKALPARKVVLSIGLFGVTCMLWFIPMVLMTGGWSTYRPALEQIIVPGAYSFPGAVAGAMRVLPRLAAEGLGAGLSLIFFAAYLLVRRSGPGYPDKSKTAFLALWILSPIFFYAITGLHPRISGYALIFLPPLFLLTAVSAGYVHDSLKMTFKNKYLLPAFACLLGINIFIFVFGHTVVSYAEIKQHDKFLSRVVGGIKTLDPEATVIITDPCMFFGYNELMYYLPEFRVHQLNPSLLPGVKALKTFWGKGRRTFLSDGLVLPEGTKNFCAVLFAEDKNRADALADVRTSEIIPGLHLAVGPVSMVRSLYPDLKVIAQGNNGL